MVSRTKKITKIIPFGAVIILVASVTGWALHKLVYDGLIVLMPNLSMFQQNTIIVILGFIILLLAGYKITDVLK